MRLRSSTLAALGMLLGAATAAPDEPPQDREGEDFIPRQTDGIPSAGAGEKAAPSESAANGDERNSVSFRDGSLILGEVLSLDALGVLRMKTPGGVERSLLWMQVVSMTSDRPLVFILRSGERVEGTAGPGFARNSLTVRGPTGEEVNVPIRLVSLINPVEKPIKIKGSLSLGASLVDGNTQTRAFDFLGTLEAEMGRHRLGLEGQTNYADDREGLQAQRSRGAAQYDVFIHDRLYGYGSALVEHDRFQDLDLRSVFSIGPGYQPARPGDYPEEYLDTMGQSIRWLNTIDLRGEGGIAYFVENYRQAPNDAYLSARWAVKMDWPVLPWVAIFHRHQGFPSLEHLEDLYVTSQQGARIQLTERFFLNLQVNWNWDNTPSPGNERNQFEYLVTFGYSFGPR